MNDKNRNESFTDYYVRIVSGVASTVISIIGGIGGLIISLVFAYSIFVMAKTGQPVVSMLIAFGLFLVAVIMVSLLNTLMLAFFYWMSPRRRDNEYQKLYQKREEARKMIKQIPVKAV